MTVRRSLASIAILLAVGASACTSTPNAKTPIHHVVPDEIADEAYAGSLFELLKDGAKSEARDKKLLGVVRRQIVHAGERYDHGAPDRATATVLGAFYLMRPGELSPVIVDKKTARGIDGAIEKLSARGDIGRARILLSLRAGSMSKSERRDVDEHLSALERFRAETLTGRVMERAGQAQRTAMEMALLDPDHIEEAVGTLDDWIAQGIQGKVTAEQTRKRPPQEEGIEIARSIASGSATLASLMLRYGDVRGAMDRIRSTSARRVTEPEFFAKLAEVDKRDDARAWRGLLEALAEEVQPRIGGDMGIDPELYAAARLGILIEAFRRDSQHAGTAVELARALSDFGMSEAVPRVLEEAVAKGATPREVAKALFVLERAIGLDASAHDVAAAARTIAASREVLARAKEVLDKRGSAGPVTDLRYAMAAILAGGGYAGEARDVLGVALAEAPRPSGYLLRGRVLRQIAQAGRDRSGKPASSSAIEEQALEDLARAIATRDANPVVTADARLLEHEIRRDRGESDAAKSALSAALGNATLAVDRTKGEKAGPARVHALASLGRVLKAYGDKAGTRKAFDRALEAATADRELLKITMLEAASCELALGDREGVRRALEKGVEGGAAQDALVHVAVWLMLADRQAGAGLDETVREIVASASSQPAWIGRLATWARGKLSDEALEKSASSEPARVEAAFFLAMARRARGVVEDDALRKIASSPVVQSREVQMARDLISPRLPLSLPPDVKIP